MSRLKSVCFGAIGLALAAVCVTVSAADKPKVVAGNGTLIIGTYPDKFWIIDEATEKVVGSIPFKSGIPRRTVISRDRALEEVWGEGEASTNSVDRYVAYLRRKLGEPPLIHTVRGVGFKLDR